MLEFLPIASYELVLFSIILFFAYIIKGLSGFGSGLIAIPLLAFFLPLTLIVPVLGLVSYSGTVIQSISYRKNVAWRDMLPLLPFSLLGIVIALWVFVNVDVTILTFILGIFIFLYSIYSLIPSEFYKGSRLWAIASGFLAGFVGTLFGTGGPFYVLYLKIRQLNKSQFRATISMTFLVDGGARIIGYSYAGFFTREIIMLTVVLLPILFIGLYIGHHLHVKIDEQRFNQVVSILLLVSGISLAIKSIFIMV